jgi:hypothetical protein
MHPDWSWIVGSGLSPRFPPAICKGAALTALNTRCTKILAGIVYDCVTWQRADGSYAGVPNVTCPDAPLLFRGEILSGGCELIPFPAAYQCQ